MAVRGRGVHVSQTFSHMRGTVSMLSPYLYNMDRKLRCKRDRKTIDVALGRYIYIYKPAHVSSESIADEGPQMFQKWTKEPPRISSPGSTQPCISEPTKIRIKLPEFILPYMEKASLHTCRRRSM